jgi:hypothetical protein
MVCFVGRLAEAFHFEVCCHLVVDHDFHPLAEAFVVVAADEGGAQSPVAQFTLDAQLERQGQGTAELERGVGEELRARNN